MKRFARGIALLTTFVLGTLLCVGSGRAEESPLGGWNILRSDYESHSPLDFVSYEWVYFMIHDFDGRFVGMVAYILGNPRGKLGELDVVIPNGGSVAVSGSIDAGPTISDFVSFGLDDTFASAQEKRFEGEQPATGYYGILTPMPGGGPQGEDAFHLEGRTEHFEWDLVAIEAWRERFAVPGDPQDEPPFTGVQGTDVGVVFPREEVFTVTSPWPRTSVTGSVVSLPTGRAVEVDAKGYLEDSFGRYLLAADGWDFVVFSSDEEEEGVAFVLQTYHRSRKLDFMDISFEDEGVIKNVRFLAQRQELGWRHPSFSFDSRARQCVPNDWIVVGQNDEYRVEFEASIGEHQAPLLSNTALATRVMFIQEQFPTITRGIVTRVASGEIVASFSGQAGGEFALRKSVLPWRSQSDCQCWGSWYFSMPLP
ncbi:MAG: hypothetical protein MUC50_07900 [Myxococcota bacterium]|nr:hypothetical protein [Myxococcota bacterium]